MAYEIENMTPAKMNLADRLVELENRFGGYHTKVPWKVRSPYAPEPRLNWLTGGDRMGFHGYAAAYANDLRDKKPGVIVELGILRGIGLAMWCELFPAARVIGLDIDLSMFNGNMSDLKARGAFVRNKPEVYELDELAPDAAERFAEILGEDTVDLFIDDALHYDAAILQTLGYCLPKLSPTGVYIIEDNDGVHKKVADQFPAYSVQAAGQLTVVRQRFKVGGY